jgi:c-di-GMP-binding flagellar brake protein YcgR
MKEDIERNTSVTERRRHPRFSAQKRALAAVSGDEFGLPYHLIDISEGGMAFRYLNDNPLPLTDRQMDIYLNEDLYVGRLPVRVVADRQLADDFFPKRRCSVAFGTLTPAQQIQLQAFIRCQSQSA